jgi:hypothetical protein
MSTGVLLVVYDEGSVAPTRIGEVARRLDCPVVFVLPDSAHNRELREIVAMVAPVVTAPDEPDQELLTRLRALRPAGVMTFSEFRIGLAARLADALGLPGVAPRDIAAITIKDTQRRRLAESGVDSVAHHVIRDPTDVDAAIAEVGFPAVLKPLVGASSRNTVLVGSAADCRSALAAVLHTGDLPETALVMEQYLEGRTTAPPWGDYLAVDCVADGADVRPVFVSGKFALAPPFRERGGHSAAEVVPDADRTAAVELACRTARALRFRHGVTHVEIKLTDAGPRVIELNGRLGAWVDDLATRSGAADPAAAAMRVALGDSVGSALEPGTREPGRIAFHYLMLPPPGALRVAAIRDVAALRELAPVDRVVVQKTPGAAVGWRLGTRGSVAALLGTTATLDELADTVAAAERTDWITYD